MANILRSYLLLVTFFGLIIRSTFPMRTDPQQLYKLNTETVGLPDGLFYWVTTSFAANRVRVLIVIVVYACASTEWVTI